MAVVRNAGYSLHYATAGDIAEGIQIVQGFIWSGATAGGNLTFKNSAGEIVLGPFTAGNNNLHVNFPRALTFNGLEVDVLSSGVVDVILA